MAVSITASNQRNASQNNTYSYAHVGNTLVLAAIGSDGGGKPTVSTVTFNGNAPTQTLYSAQTGGAATTGCSLFIWEGLSDVTANIVINFSRATAGGLMAVSLSGAPSSSVVDTYNIATGTGTTASVSLTSVDSGSLVLDFVGVQGDVTSTLAEDGSQTEWATPTHPGSWTTNSASSKSSSGSVTMQWTWTGSQNYSLMSVAILAAAGPVTFSDDFNRADGVIGSNWTDRNGSMDIRSNAFCEALGSNSYCGVATSAATFAADHEAQITVTAIGNADWVGVAVRVNASGCYAFAADTNSGARGIIRMDGTTRTFIGTVQTAFAVSDVIKLRAVGSTITAFKNGVQFDQVTDTTHATGQPGLFYNRSNINASRGDDFTATDYVVGTTDLGTATGAPRATVRVAGLSTADTKYAGIVTPGSGIGYIAADPALANGDVVEYDRTVSGYEVTIANDGSWSIAGSPPDGWYNFQFRVIDDVAGPWAPQSVRVLTPVDVTDVNTDERLYNGGPFTITGTGFGASQGASKVYINAVEQTVLTWSDTTITGTVTGMTTPGNYNLVVVRA